MIQRRALLDWPQAFRRTWSFKNPGPPEPWAGNLRGRSLDPVVEHPCGFFGVARFVTNHILELHSQTLVPEGLRLFRPFRVVLYGPYFRGQDGLQLSAQYSAWSRSSSISAPKNWTSWGR